MLLELADVTKKYRLGKEKKAVLDGLDLTLDRGELVSITGKSGCGKTTLLNIISGLASPDGGTVLFNGRRINYALDIFLSGRRNREMGFIFQSFRLVDSRSVMWNVLLPARIRGRLGRKTREYMTDILSRLKIWKFRDSPVGVLSGGQKQRVAIARALVNSPSIILADEPTANLDLSTAREISDILEGIKNEGKAVLVVTHNEHLHEISSSVYSMEEGRLIRRP